MAYVLVLCAWLYGALSYLLLLRDGFLLERIGLSLGLPWFEPMMLSLAATLKAPLTSTLGVIVVLVGMIAVYLRLLITRPRLSRRTFRWVTIGVYVPMLLAFPILSTDIFDYTNANRIVLEHNLNPWLVPANSIEGDGELYAGSWLDRPSIYPPLTIGMGLLVGSLFGTTMIPSIIGYKLVSLALVAIMAAIALKAKRTSPLWVVLWHPILLIEVVGNLHNDILMAVCVLGILVARQKEQPGWLTLAWVGSVFAKVSTVVLAPFVISRWHKHHWGLALFGSLAAALVWLLLPHTLTSSYLHTLESQLSILHRSLPQQVVTLTSSFGMVEGHVLMILNGVWLVVLMRLWWLRQKLSMAEIVTWVFVSYLLIAAPMIQPWYGLWFLPALWFGQRQLWWKAAQAVLLSGLFTYVVYNLSLWMAPLWFGWQTILYTTVALPLVALYLWQRVILKAVS